MSFIFVVVVSVSELSFRVYASEAKNWLAAQYIYGLHFVCVIPLDGISIRRRKDVSRSGNFLFV